MTQDEIMEMAREASSMARLPWNGEWIFRSKKELMAFVALVAAKERDACAKGMPQGCHCGSACMRYGCAIAFTSRFQRATW